MSVRLFVGNLSYDVTEAELRDLFATVGTPATIRIPMDRETGKPRGFAFVEYADRSQAEEAISRFHQHNLKGRMLAVNEARAPGEAPPPKPANEAFRPPPRPPRPVPLQGEPDLAEGAGPGQPRGTFGADARTRTRRKREEKNFGGEREPKRTIRERSSGQLFHGADEDDDFDEGDLDDFALWAREDKKSGDEDE